MIIKYKSNRVNSVSEFVEINKIDSIWIDMDGCMIRSVDAVVGVLNNIQNSNYKGSDVRSMNFKEVWKQDFNGLDELSIENLFRNEIFWTTVKWVNGCEEFIDNYKDKIKIITKGTKENLFYKQIWLENQGYEDIPFIGIPFNVSKNVINMDGLFVDDSTKNLLESNASYKIQFLEYNDLYNNKREWTKDWCGLKTYRWI